MFNFIESSHVKSAKPIILEKAKVRCFKLDRILLSPWCRYFTIFIFIYYLDFFLFCNLFANLHSLMAPDSVYGAKKGEKTMKIVKYLHHRDRKIGCNKSHVVGVHWHQIIFLSRGILVLSSENYNILISNSYVLQTNQLL